MTNYFDNDFCQSLQPPLVLPRRGDAGYSELSKTGWCRLLRIAKDRLVQVKNRLVQVTLVDVSNVLFHRDFVQFWARCLPTWGKHVAQHGQARCPTWARLLHLGTFAARKLPICPQYVRLRLGLNGILLVHFFCDEPRVSVLPRMITHPNLPQGKGQVTLLCQRLQQINSANEHQPPPNLPRRGGTVTIAVDKRLIIR